nr:recombinase family protein [Pedobacter sp. Leaf216]
MKIGYARVSTADQNLDLQFNALTDYGCTTIYQEKISGKNTDRPELKNLLATLRKDDQVVVWKLDRLGRSLRDLVDLVAVFNEKGVNFVSLHDHIDTTTATGRFTFNIFASLAEFEREIIRERTKAGLVAARARG